MPALSTELLEDFFAALRPRLTGPLRTDAMTRALYATDASLYEIQPLGVLLPRHADDVQAAMETAARFKLPVLARGGGSSLAGQTVGAALVVDFSRHLDAVLDVDPEARTVRVEPGITLDALNRAVASYGLMVGPDPSSGNRATLGGMLANNATGTHSILYGNMIEHVRAVRALLADGSAVDLGALDAAGWERRLRGEGFAGGVFRGLDALLRERGEVVERDTPTHWRRNSGYRLEYLLGDGERNPAQLLCGSEGTLAVATEIELDLVPRPARTALGVVHFHTRREALRAVTTILETEPSAVELFDGVVIEQARRAPGFARRLTFLEGDPGAVLITEYYGTSTAELEDRLDRLERTLRAAGEGYAVLRLLDAPRIRDVWTVRKEGLGLVMGVKGDYKPVAFIEDASVPVEHLADYVDDLDALLAETGTRGVFYAHASAGCLHIRPFINTKDAAEVRKMRDIAEGSAALVARYGGYVSSEHGDGIVRSWLTPRLVGPELYDTYRRLKGVFDPDNLLNPGKVVDAPEMTEQLRMGPAYETIPFVSELDFSDEGGFAGAVELCNGNGACRKLGSGTMCPSFMATREEEHSTRGRANALRSVLSGALPPEELTGERLYEVLDLCIQCKACKSECPSNVDMAKLKTVWLARYWREHGVPRRTRLFAEMPKLARRLPAPLAGGVNWLNRRGVVRSLLHRTLGISREREMPTFARTPFDRWFRAQGWTSDGPTVVLFADTFSNHQHPETARAAAEFLHGAGYRVVVPDARACCGRTYLSKGLVSEAQIQALRAVEILHPYAEQGLPIVGLEPSCILTFADEVLAMLPGDPRARTLAGAVHTFEAFVLREAEAGRLDGVRWRGEKQRLLFHGHCHQKALVGTDAAARCLALPGFDVEVLDAGCCGMAGAFGYEKEHYDVSIAMAELRLAPAVRAAPEALIVAPGTSCRTQIHDTTGRRAYHPAEVLRMSSVECRVSNGS